MDWDLIVSSFLSQYGIRLSTKQFNTVKWGEFRSLLAGIAPDTALGRVVEIRSEKDSDVIKNFTADQRRIYEEWRQYRVSTISEDQFQKEMDNLEKMFAAMCS